MDLKLNSDTHDLQITNYDLTLNTGSALVQQRLRQTLWFFLGEWYLDITDGVPYYDDILIKAPDQITVESTLKAAILGTPGVLELKTFDLEYTNNVRQLKLDFEVSTIYGDLTISEEI